MAVLSSCGLLTPALLRSNRMPRIGWLSPANGADSRVFIALRQGLTELGYVEGQNISIESRVAGGNNERLPALAAELVSLGVDLIVTDGSLAAATAQNATHTIPIVMGTTGDPVASGLVARLDRPGGNITGFIGSDLPGMYAKRLQLFEEAIPGLSRVVVLLDAKQEEVAHRDSEIQPAAAALGIELIDIDVRSTGGLEAAFQVAKATQANGLLTINSPLLGSQRQRVVALALEHRLPGMYTDRDFAVQGGLLAYGPNIPEVLRRSASYVDRVLRGANAGELPIQRPTEFDFAINLKTAQALGLTIPPSVLTQATEVLQ
jgi:putative ABC transport system substrate-binding protein